MGTPQSELPKGSTIRGQLIGDQNLRSKSLFAQQLAHEAECGVLIAMPLDQHVEDLALVIDRPPQVHALPGDPDDHLVEVPWLPGMGRRRRSSRAIAGPNFQTQRRTVS